MAVEVAQLGAEATPTTDLSTQEKLLLSQAVYKVGAAAWQVISDLLRDHPVVKGRPAELFTPEACEKAYISLMTSIGQNVPAPDAIKPRAKTHLRLAQTFYIARLTELKSEIESYETKFTLLVGEINAIKSGELDDALKEEIRAGLVKKYGKKLSEWIPSTEEIKSAVEAGPIVGSDAKQDEAEDNIVESEKPVELVEEETQVDVPAEEEKAQADEEPEAEVAEDSVPLKVEEKEDVDMEETETPATPTPKPSPPASELSEPPPSTRKTEGDDTPAAASSPTPVEEPTTRSSKRKASTQPKGAPIPKRSGRGRRATSPSLSQAEPTSDAENEQEAEEEENDEEPEANEEEQEEEEPQTGRGRRQSRRSGRHDTPTAATRKDKKDKGGSPAPSKRAPSVSSTASAPQTGDEKRTTRRGRGRGMRDEVVSKNVREQSEVDAGESAKEEEDGEEEEEGDTRATRSRRGKKEATPEDKEEKKGGRRTRHAKTPTPHDRADDETPEKERDREVVVKRESVSTRSSAPPKGPRRSEGKEGKANQKMLLSLLDTVQGHRFASVFQNPVKKSEAPDYHEIIKKPMDLKTIRQRIREGIIGSVDEFERDVLLMFANAMMYNDEGSQVYDMAQEMLRDSEGHIAQIRSMQQESRR